MKNHKAEEKKTKTDEPSCEAEAQAVDMAGVELEKQKVQAADYYNQLLRLQADFENYRKRQDKEKPEWLKLGKADILIRLLPLYDMLLSAHAHLNAAKENGNGDETLKGLEMIFKEFSKVFDAEGLRAMEPVGKPYDPMASEILGIVDGTEENDGLVVEELQKGFYYGDKILRPARVKIAKKKLQEPPPAEEAQAAEEVKE
jgi:molecular chaperone GrpE